MQARRWRRSGRSIMTSRRTIEHDFAHAIELLKSLPDEDARQKAHVYMEGLAEMRNEWAKPAAVPKKGRKTGKADEAEETAAAVTAQADAARGPRTISSSARSSAAR